MNPINAQQWTAMLTDRNAFIDSVRAFSIALEAIGVNEDEGVLAVALIRTDALEAEMRCAARGMQGIAAGVDKCGDHHKIPASK